MHGLIFLFKWIGTSAVENASGSIVQDDRLDKIFFARQVIQNACATQVQNYVYVFIISCIYLRWNIVHSST